jgi:transposase
VGFIMSMGQAAERLRGSRVHAPARVRPLDCQPHATGAILENQALERARDEERCHAETAPLAANKYAPPRTLAVSAACTVGRAVDTPAQISHLTADGHRSGGAQCCCVGGMRAVHADGAQDAAVMSRTRPTRCAVHLPECNMQPRAKLKPLTLTRDEREQLEQWVRDCQGSRPLALRARIVLSCQAGCSNRDSAKRLKVTAQTVGKWRARFAAQGMRGLADQPRSGAPRSISDAMVEAVLAKTLHSKPPDAARWSSRRLAATVGVSQRTVLRIWRAFGL